MTKSIFFLGLVFLFISCGSSVESFYDRHKNDANVTAVRVPKFMYSLLGSASPEVKDVMKNVSDIRYMNLPSSSSLKNQQINTEIDKITKSGYSDIFRKNNNENRSLLTVKEQGNTIKQIILHNSNGSNNSLLYLKGNFDAGKIRKMAEDDTFTEFNSILDNKY
ncbi:DUF4252 domain-containing protein [Galbibacter mesophilus]|uniref:DUF4252 domain-containing protein n=1 Tax=Galbibacter mesophilus TaxID=379069 RepID=UPI00191F3A8F|nr:DUF4252 domain-containing protein [Galbibacter mesophilus]MCM5663560.1 DUF4252 domain-containing protein [Galbibacter mesophilus]